MNKKTVAQLLLGLVALLIAIIIYFNFFNQKEIVENSEKDNDLIEKEISISHDENVANEQIVKDEVNVAHEDNEVVENNAEDEENIVVEDNEVVEENVAHEEEESESEIKNVINDMIVNVIEDDEKKDEIKLCLEEKEDLVNTNNEIETNKELETNVEKSENKDVLEEVEINLDEIKENISLKEPNEVYIEIYRVAKEKAKQARKVAIETYLEAQNIKNTYMLNDLDSSDDEDFDLNIS